jgi:hypothetical protein
VSTSISPSLQEHPAQGPREKTGRDTRLAKELYKTGTHSPDDVIRLFQIEFSHP